MPAVEDYSFRGDLEWGHDTALVDVGQERAPLDRLHLRYEARALVLAEIIRAQKPYRRGLERRG
jgi:hypothetical protein